MPNFGIIELVVLLAIFIPTAVLAAAFVIGVRRSTRATLPTPGPLTPHQLEDHVRALVHQKKKMHAIKLLRDQSGLSLIDAKNLTERIAAGHHLTAPPGHLPPAHTSRADLATRVRELKADDRTEQAVHLVRGETGMDQSAAELFVSSL
jgi:hypothetical protein